MGREGTPLPTALAANFGGGGGLIYTEKGPNPLLAAGYRLYRAWLLLSANLALTRITLIMGNTFLIDINDLAVSSQRLS